MENSFAGTRLSQEVARVTGLHGRPITIQGVEKVEVNSLVRSAAIARCFLANPDARHHVSEPSNTSDQGW